MAPMGGGTPTIQIPRWIQLVGLPMIALLVWVMASQVVHAVVIFLVAALVALLLDPLVRAITHLWIPRGFAIAIVYLSFAAALTVVIVAIGIVVVDQSQSAADRIDNYLRVENGQSSQTGFEEDVDDLQLWLNDHRLTRRIDIREQGNNIAEDFKNSDVEKYTTRAIDFLRGAALGIFGLIISLVLVVVVSVYMLLDMNRLAGGIDRRFPPPPGTPGLVVRMEHAVAGYVRGQVLVSLTIGASVGVGMWLLGTLDWVPGADKYAVLFGAWAAFTELIPYLGPILGGVPAVIYGLIVDPISALWILLLFLAIHQIEGHIVVPKLMGSALRLHPLLVIFGLLAGGELYGLLGIFIALPLLAVGRAVWEFFRDRVDLEPWTEGGHVPVEVELEEAAQRPVRVTGPVEGVPGEAGGSAAEEAAARRLAP